jgi:ATP-binding cassette subfamily C protein CydD
VTRLSEPSPTADRVAALRRRLAETARGTERGAIGFAVIQGLLGLGFARLVAAATDGIVFSGTDLAGLLPLLAGLVAIAVARAAAGFGADLCGRRVADAVRRRLFRDLLDRFAALGPVRLARRPVGEVVGTTTDAVAAIEADLRAGAAARARAVAVPVAVLAVLAATDLWAFAILVVVTPLLPMAMILTGRGAEEANRRQWEALARLGGHLLDVIRGLPELKLAGASAATVGEVRTRAEDFGRRTMAVLRIAFLSSLALEFFATAAIAGTAVAVGFRLLSGSIGFETGFFVLLIVPEYFTPLRALGPRRHARMEADAALATIADLLDAPAAGPALVVGRRRRAPGAPHLRFEAVGLTHADGTRALDRLDLDIAAGERLALVGRSGAGKSTLFALLCGFLAPTEGRILVDGVDLAELDPDDWRRTIVHLPQTPHLFARSVADNLGLGRAPAGDDAAALAAALDAAGAADFVAALPDGLATRLGDGGAGLSGGEIQRLALARAFYAPGDLVLFDEPTAHLDATTEAALGPAIARLSEGRTSLTIAHRLETLAEVDRIVVLDAGRIVGAFRPSDLAEADRRRAITAAVLGYADDAEGRHG